MEERRRHTRFELESQIVVKRMDDGYDEVETIDITDVSKTGVGFRCTQALVIGAVYESYLTIWTKDVLHAFLKIVRIELAEDAFEYGAIFVGMPELDSSKIGIYETVQNNE